MEVGEECFTRGVGVELGGEGGELGCVERGAFGVGEEAVEGAGDVAEVEGDGGEVVGAGVALGVGEGGGIQPNVFAVDNPRAPGDQALTAAERTVAAKLR